MRSRRSRRSQPTLPGVLLFSVWPAAWLAIFLSVWLSGSLSGSPVGAQPGLAQAQTPATAPAVVAAAPEAELSLPIITVYTMGPGEDLFSRFGHAAICVTDELSPAGRCYNYGTADFSTPGPLTWSFLRGRAQFWVSVAPEPRMLSWYRAEDRSVWRQRLRLPLAEARRIALLLHEADIRERTFYRYHHFNDNCTTRIRDVLDRATGGRLRAHADGREPSPAWTIRRHVENGFDGVAALQALAELLLGRSADGPPSNWASMFLPEFLRLELTLVYDTNPELVYERRAPLSRGLPLGSSGGQLRLLSLGLGLLGLVVITRGRPRLSGLARAAAAAVLGLTAVLVWGMAIASVLPEFRYNEVLLVCLPTDFLIPWLGARNRARYLTIRLVGLGAVALLSLSGLLVQPLLAPLSLVVLPLGALRWLARQSPAAS